MRSICPSRYRHVPKRGLSVIYDLSLNGKDGARQTLLLLSHDEKRGRDPGSRGNRGADSPGAAGPRRGARPRHDRRRRLAVSLDRRDGKIAESGLSSPQGKNFMTVHQGKCFCGTVQFTVSGEPEAMGYCHCESCRSWSAGPVNAFTLWKPAAVKVTAGAEHIGTFNKTPHSFRTWWAVCGGHLNTHHPGMGLTD